jgi:hypothetical protein
VATETEVGCGEIDAGVAGLRILQIVAGNAGDLSIQKYDVAVENCGDWPVFTLMTRRRIGDINRMGTTNGATPVQAAGYLLCH